MSYEIEVKIKTVEPPHISIKAVGQGTDKDELLAALNLLFERLSNSFEYWEQGGVCLRKDKSFEGNFYATFKLATTFKPGPVHYAVAYDEDESLLSYGCFSLKKEE